MKEKRDVFRIAILLFLVGCSSSSTNEDGLFGGSSGVAGQSAGGAAGTTQAGGAAGEADAVAPTCKLPEQTAGDCVVAICDGDSATLVSDFADVPADDGDPCTDDVCTTGGTYGFAEPAHPQKAVGAPCGNGKVCDASGACD